MKAKAILLLLLAAVPAVAQEPKPEPESRVGELERKLEDATRQLGQLQAALQSLRSELAGLKRAMPLGAGNVALSNAIIPSDVPAPAGRRDPVTTPATDAAQKEFGERLIAPGLAHSEREVRLQARPEIFIQSRYAALPIKETNGEFEPNFSMTRIETRWSGRISERIGAGLEIQFHPALDGSAEELVNDAFVEYYLNPHATLRVGQFIKPFGFDIQQSSAVRESPERGIFAGYFFPGQRDRGVMLFGDLNFTPLKRVQYFVGVFNGNRFFADNNRQANYVLRVRKFFDRPQLALGLSAQIGKQILPPGVRGNNDENLIGFDFQTVLGRFGLRGEAIAGNTPSTLLGIEPVFAAAFRPGAKSSGAALFATYRLTDRDHVYTRYDQFNRDPVKGYNVRAFSLGYLRYLGEATRFGFDYQFKNRPSFNDDAMNGRLHLTWSIEF
jgi:hypothetical protein